MVKSLWLPLLVMVGLLLAATPLRAEDEADLEEPIPSSVEEIKSPMDRMGAQKPVRPGLFPWLKRQLKDTDPFFRDTSLVLNLRNYYYRRSRYDETVSEAWAQGGALSYKSGWLFERFSVGADLYTSQPLHAPSGADGSNLLAPGQKGYTVLGQVYGRVKLYEGLIANLYRYGDFNTPYLNKDDGRMTPYSFEGYTLQGVAGGKDGGPRLNYGGGYLTKIKDKTSESFVWMSTKAGAEVKRGLAVAGALYTQGPFSLGAMDYFCEDIINIVYSEAKFVHELPQGVGVRAAAQFTTQRSIGSNALKGYGFSVNQAGLRADVSYRNAILTMAYTANSRGYDLQNPWSGYPGYTSVMTTDYNKAGVSAVMGKLSYDFSRLGLEGVAASVLYAHGWGMVDPVSKEPLPNENEFDADLQWRPEFNFLKGFWFRVRYGVAHQYQGEHRYTHDGRVIVNYDLVMM